METLEQQFSARVNAFLELTGMSPTTFGMRAVGDPNLIRQMRKGRSPSLRTADRTLAYIASYPAASGGVRAPPRRRAKRERPMERNTNRPARILRSREVEARTGLSRSTLYRWRLAGRFPPAVTLGPRSVGWIESDVDAWIQERSAESRGGGRPPSTDPSEKGKR